MTRTPTTALSEALIARCGERAATYDRENRFFTEDFEELRDAGYLQMPIPREFGGGGGPAAEQIVIDQELAAAGAPEYVGVVGLDVLGPSLLRFGTDEQRRRYVSAIFSAQEIWC